MIWVLFFPALLQGAVIGVDEFVFHRERGLPLWEKIGHPLDSLSLLLCIGAVLVLPYSARAIYFYAALGGFSCLLITKDEFVHTGRCKAAENWLHALLFVLHPVVIALFGLAWARGLVAGAFRGFLFLEFFGILSFMFYQIGYWGWFANETGK
jgi:hypothetical protein